MRTLNGSPDHDLTSRARGLQHAALLRLARLGVDAEAMLLAPSLDERSSAAERSRDELLRLEDHAECYAELTGRSLLEDTRAAAALLPRPSSWLETLGAQLALSVAAKALETRESSASPAALAEHREHVAAALSALDSLCEEVGPAALSAARGALQGWTDVAAPLLEDDALRSAFRAELTSLTEGLAAQRRAA
jgi:hypothetical protein